MIFASALFAGLAATPVAQACSLISGYKVPTTLELSASAEAIILARVGRALPVEEDDFMGVIELVPETLIHGAALPETLTMPGYVVVDGRVGEDEVPVTKSDPEELAAANPDAFAGACNRYAFDEGMLLLLFLERGEDGDLQVISDAFARTMEDVPDADAPWVRAVRFYAQVARDPKPLRRKKLAAERDRLLATGDRIDALIAKDIERQIRGKRSQNFD
ncbi:MAG TPA: hypothetical protein PKD99_04560 [Sphingopyxis sp.]|nr:hypothetical protein [Sphingopyxis sp.]HMP44357.1 hypothetical protein [Sphingopyxis sp.]HMQ18221.1 hypothetical protein [Sphingopyxis sp.]